MKTINSLFVLVLVGLSFVSSCRSTHYVPALPKTTRLDSFQLASFDVYAKYDTLLNSPGEISYTTSLVDSMITLGVHYLFVAKGQTWPRKVFHCTPIHYYHRFTSPGIRLVRRTDPNFNDSVHLTRNLINVREILQIREGELHKQGDIVFNSTTPENRQTWAVEFLTDSSSVKLESLTSNSFAKKNNNNLTVRLDTIFSNPVIFKRMVNPALVFATPGDDPERLADSFYFTSYRNKYNSAYFPMVSDSNHIKKLKDRVYRSRNQ
ncbi:hypothetical protein [Sphingobacterium pedocola]|uniref:Lipoprotein n=1 Tax=Sphingobacterium pedocola TaxID=2082722 RepID=A0ABR9T418_9SPHI|nr:hypothetical protein [Sphingobacterium pedocola]MBE8719634.1 hypothetical protein [Sphingobacterium pedocola]